LGIIEQFTFGDFEFIKKLDVDYNIDLVCQHGRYSKGDLEEMVGENALFLTILRDPVEQFLSLWYFFGYKNVFEMDLNTWLNNNIA